MRLEFYPRLAAGGIYKNRKLYLPYLLTCIGMVMMYYIISFLTRGRNVAAMHGGEEMQMVLGFGCGVIAVFAVVFLFYTNSFLIRRRKKEFGLYNILGMGKRNLFWVLFWENLFIAVIALFFGLLCGILFSKLAELCMARILATEISLSFTIEVSAVLNTLQLFGIIFVLLYLNGIRQIHVSKPIDLMNSEKAGEKPPKANWPGAVFGMLLLGVAYYLAVSIEDPLAAILWFFVAVVMVILATYLLFIAGSVVLCRLLQRNKKYYYKTNHFVSVSSMIYRMRRNGAGLASICILSTMVLVMISSTACLFIGKESSLRNRYPRNVVVDTYSIEENYTTQMEEIIKTAVEQNGLLQENILHYQYLDVAGYLMEDEIIFDMDKLEDFSISGYENIRQLFIVPVSEYNRLMGKEETLKENEVLLYTTKTGYEHDTITIEGCNPMQVKEQVSEFVDNGVDSMQVISSMFLFVPDFETLEQIFDIQAAVYEDNRSYKHDYYGFDVKCDDETMAMVRQNISDQIQQKQLADAGFPTVSCESVGEERHGFYALYGGMFFLGVLLGLVFMIAAVLIIYYKQISEGYEDQSRFHIMQKVGMTKKEIQRSINSQVLTVFFLPLIAAGIHTAFAFPLVSKMLAMFALTDRKLMILVAIGSYLLFVVFYMLVYKMTSHAYFRLVSAGE